MSQQTVKFWMVLGTGEPLFRHPTKHSARIEAERLARSHPGVEFIVLESLGSVIKPDVRWTAFGDVERPDDPDVPF